MIQLNELVFTWGPIVKVWQERSTTACQLLLCVWQFVRFQSLSWLSGHSRQSTAVQRPVNCELDITNFTSQHLLPSITTDNSLCILIKLYSQKHTHGQTLFRTLVSTLNSAATQHCVTITVTHSNNTLVVTITLLCPISPIIRPWWLPLQLQFVV